MMRDLLDSSSLRRLKFIECMLEENRWWKTENIAAKLNCSESTVKSDINYFRLYFTNMFEFETSKQKGIRLIIFPSFQIDTFHQRIMSECLNVQFINLLFYDSFYTLEGFADELYTSVSSVKRCIEQAKIVLSKYGLTIQQKPIRITGHARQILFFYGVLFWEEYGTSFFNLDFSYKREAYELVESFKNEKKLSLSPTVMAKISLWITLLYERMSQGYHMNKEYKPLLVTSKEMGEFIYRELSLLPFEITSQDVQFISYFLESRYIYFKRETIESDQGLLNIYDNIETFLTILVEETTIPLKNKKVVQKRLFSHFLYKLEFEGLNYTLVERNKITVHNYEGLYDEFLETAVEILKQNEKTKWVEVVLEDTIDFLYILISTWENLTTEILKKQKKMNVLIASQLGYYHEKFIEELVHIRYPYKLNTFLLTEENYPSTIELIITDYGVEEFKLQLENNIPVIGISYSSNNHSWEQLKDVIDQIYSEQRLLKTINKS